MSDGGTEGPRAAVARPRLLDVVREAIRRHHVYENYLIRGVKQAAWMRRSAQSPVTSHAFIAHSRRLGVLAVQI